MKSWNGRGERLRRHRAAPRLWLICQWFPPEPVLIPRNIAQSLQNAGLAVHVITGCPNYPTGVVQGGYSARRFSSERLEGIPVDRCPLYPSHDGSALGRFANYISWASTATLRAITRVRRGDVALVYSSPATAALPAIVCKLLFGTPFVILIQDLWPDSVLATGFVDRRIIQRLVKAFIVPLVALSYRLASHITVISPGMVDVLKSRGVPGVKLSLTYNWADEGVYRPCAASPTFRGRLGISEDVFLAMYAGNLGRAQALDDVIRAVGMASEDCEVALVLVGSGIAEEDLHALADRVAPGRVFFAPPMPTEEVPAAMASADIQVVALKDEPAFAHAMPSKVQAILASGLPLIAAASGDLRDVVVSSGAGWAAAPGAIEELAQCFRQAATTTKADLRSRGILARNYYDDTMSEAVNARHLVMMIEDVSRVASHDNSPRAKKSSIFKGLPRTRPQDRSIHADQMTEGRDHRRCHLTL